MKNWLRDNSTLAAGILLPLLLIAIFATANFVQKIGIEKPKYDFLFSIADYSIYKNSPDIKFSVLEDKLNIAANKPYSNYRYRLFRFIASSGKAKEINIPEPVFGSEKTQVPIKIPELDSLRLDTNEVSSDGYIFMSPYDLGGSGLRPAIFFGRSVSEYGCMLKKKNVIIPILKNKYDNFCYKSGFIGWIKE